jgi:hypothetical protein
MRVSGAVFKVIIKRLSFVTVIPTGQVGRISGRRGRGADAGAMQKV